MTELNDFFREFFSHLFAGPVQTALVVLCLIFLYHTFFKSGPRT